MVRSGRRARALFGCVVVIAAGCTSSTRGPAASAAAATSAPATAAATRATAATPPAPSAPPFEQIEPAASIDVPGASGAIAIASDGTTVWAVGHGVLLRIDSKTDAVTQLEAPVETDDTGLAIADDGLWVTRWAGGHLYRVDPRTGAVQLTVAMPSAVSIAFIGDHLWVGQESLGAMVEVDRKTGARGRSVAQGAYGLAALGDLWFVDKSGTTRRVDPLTGAVKARIDLPGEPGCGIGGVFPENVWTGCFGWEVKERSIARIDLATNAAATTTNLPPSHGGGVVLVGDQPWFIGSFEDSSGPFAGLLRLNRGTGAIERFVSVRGVDPDGSVVAGGALWMADEHGKRIVRIDLAELAS